MLRPVFQFVAVVGVALGIMSLFTLAQLTIKFGLSVPGAVLVEYYDNMVNAVFSWAEPIASLVLLWIKRALGLELTLDPIWKHVLVLQWLYFSADARANFERQRNGFAFFTIIWGVIVGFIGSVATGTTALGEANLNILAVSIPVIAIVVFELGRVIMSATFKLPSPGRTNDQLSRREIFAYLLWRFPIAIAVIGNVVILFAVFFPLKQLFGENANENLLTLAIFLIALTGLFIGRGLFGVSGRHRTKVSVSIFKRFSQSTSGRIGLLMVATIGGAVLVILTNAGLSHYGL